MKVNFSASVVLQMIQQEEEEANAALARFEFMKEVSEARSDLRKIERDLR